MLKNCFLIVLFSVVFLDRTFDQIKNYTVIADRIINYSLITNKGKGWEACAEFCDSKFINK